MLAILVRVGLTRNVRDALAWRQSGRVDECRAVQSRHGQAIGFPDVAVTTTG